MTVLQLTSDQVAALRRADRLGDLADASYALCPCCAMPEWRSTRLDGAGNTVVELGLEPCSNCQEIRYRHPDVFEWVMRAITAGHALRKMMPSNSGGGG